MSLYDAQTLDAIDTACTRLVLASKVIMSNDIIEKKVTLITLLGHVSSDILLRKAFKSFKSLIIVSRHNELFVSKTGVVFFGTDTQVTDIYDIKADKKIQ